MDIKDKMLDLVDAERVTIFALDTKNQELFSLFKAGQEVKEIRVPKTFASIAGFTALSRKTVNIKNAYDAAELTTLHPSLRFDARWDKASGFRTEPGPRDADPLREVPAGRPPAHQQARRRRLLRPRTRRRRRSSRKILGIAFYNQHRAARTNKPSKFGALVDKGLVSEKDIEKAVANARVNQLDVAKILMEELQGPQGGDLQGPRPVLQLRASGSPPAHRCPEDIKQRVTADFLKKNMCAPDREAARARCASPWRTPTTSPGSTPSRP